MKDKLTEEIESTCHAWGNARDITEASEVVRASVDRVLALFGYQSGWWSLGE